MDRFAFLASQPWLYPPPDDVASALCGGDDARVLVVSDDGVHRFIPAHLLLDADFDGVLRTPPARGRVAHHHHHADLSVVFDGCASFHFSEREQYGHPPAPPRADRDVGTPGVVGAAASDALHMAFAPTDECPDQAQFACRIRARRCERVQPETDPHAAVLPPGTTTWLEITIDGFARAVDLSQARHVVVGPPIDARPDPKHREPDLISPDRRARRPSHRHHHHHRRRRRRRRRGRDARGEFGSDSEDSCRYDCDCDDDDDESPFGASGNRAEDVGFDRRLTTLTANAPRNTQTPGSDDIDDDARAEAGETPYASVVFSHVTLNLYHDAGLLGCRRASPAGEREKIAAVRDAIERFRAAAADAATNAATSRALAPSSAEAPSQTPTPTPHGVSSAQPQPGDSHSPLGAPTTPNTDTAVHRQRLRARAGEVRAASAAAIATRRELERALVAATRLATESAEDENEGDEEIDENDDAGGAGNVPGAREGRLGLARALTRAARRSAEALEETRRESERRSRRARRVAAALDEAARDADAEGAGEDAAWRDELARMRGWTDEATLVEGRERSTSADELGEARFA